MTVHIWMQEETLLKMFELGKTLSHPVEKVYDSKQLERIEDRMKKTHLKILTLKIDNFEVEIRKSVKWRKR